MNEILCRGNEIIISWERDNYIVGTRYYFVGTR